ncbi:MAG: LemA family protein [Ignavibacteriae bacterium]|nr:LemA family protein [Ignavibacteria bacterium]MBI3365736.1 LemA family protein [Ignavibacteriota bacterium]
MKRNTIIIFAIVGILVLLAIGIVGCATGMYNTLVRLDESTKQAWGQVQNQYQRRYDLIPNLVETVRGYAEHERDVFEKVAEARANVGKLTVTPEILNNPQTFQRFQEAQASLTSALSRLLAVAENYPQLKANENFLQLQSQLEGTENRIAVARNRFNDIVQEYNTNVRTFPTAMFAGMFGFGQKAYFQAEPGAEKVPKVDFNKLPK